MRESGEQAARHTGRQAHRQRALQNDPTSFRQAPVQYEPGSSDKVRDESLGVYSSAGRVAISAASWASVAETGRGASASGGLDINREDCASDGMSSASPSHRVGSARAGVVAKLNASSSAEPTPYTHFARASAGLMRGLLNEVICW